MSDASSLEQYMLELINAERAAVGAAPLAFNGQLNSSAETHSLWMLATDNFSHTGDGGSSPGDRMEAAGYVFAGGWTWGENIAYQSTRGAPGLQDDVADLHDNLMNSSGHRANILSGSFREIGIGVEQGNMQGWDAAIVTQNFAKSGSDFFLLGVAFDDLDGDDFYDVGEGLGGVTVTISGNGQNFQTATTGSGGYQVALGPGSYSVTFSGNGFQSQTESVVIDGGNVKLDLADFVLVGGSGGGADPGGGDPNAMNGSSQSDFMEGGSGGDTIYARQGADQVFGRDGADVIYGNQGGDILYGNQQGDRIFGGQGDDYVAGGQQQDVLYGNFQDDEVFGNFGNDTLFGGQDTDLLHGGQGDDLIFGNRGDDLLVGGQGADTLVGGAGSDRFFVDEFDTIADLEPWDIVLPAEDWVLYI